MKPKCKIIITCMDGNKIHNDFKKYKNKNFDVVLTQYYWKIHWVKDQSHRFTRKLPKYIKMLDFQKILYITLLKELLGKVLVLSIQKE